MTAANETTHTPECCEAARKHGELARLTEELEAAWHKARRDRDYAAKDHATAHESCAKEPSHA